MPEFCNKCGAVMVPKKKRKLTYMTCLKCGHEKQKNIRSMKIKEKQPDEENHKMVVLDEDKTNLPTTEKECPDCGHDTAYWWLQQTRGQDEPPTQFFKCEKCGNTWREYK